MSFSLSPPWTPKLLRLFTLTSSLALICTLLLAIALGLQPACQLPGKLLLVCCTWTAVDTNRLLASLLAAECSPGRIDARLSFVWLQLRVRAVLGVVPAALATYLVFEDYVGLQENPRYRFILQPTTTYPEGLDWTKMLDSNRCYSSSSGYFYYGQIVQTIVALSSIMYFGILFLFVSLLWFLQHYANLEPLTELELSASRLMTESVKYLDPQAGKRSRKVTPRFDWYEGLVNMKNAQLMLQDAGGEDRSLDIELVAINHKAPAIDQQPIHQRNLLKDRSIQEARAAIKAVLSPSRWRNWVNFGTYPESSFIMSMFIAGSVHLLLKRAQIPKIAEKNDQVPTDEPIKEASDLEVIRCSWCQDVCQSKQLPCGHFYHRFCLQQMVMNRVPICKATGHTKSPEPFVVQLANM